MPEENCDELKKIKSTVQTAFDTCCFRYLIFATFVNALFELSDIYRFRPLLSTTWFLTFLVFGICCSLEMCYFLP